jgi:hypothetical protein
MANPSGNSSRRVRALVQLLPHHHPRLGLPQPEDRARDELSRRTHERLPPYAPRVPPHRVEEQRLDLSRLPLAPSEETRRDDPRVVHHEQVPGPEPRRQVPEPLVVEPARSPLHHEEPRRVALGERRLGDPFRGKVVVEIGEMHGLQRTPAARAT